MANKSYNSQANYGTFVPTTNIWGDASRIASADVNSQEFKDLIVRLYQNVNLIALSLNLRDAGFYVLEEFLNGQLYFPNPELSSTTSVTPAYRQVYRFVIDWPTPLPNTTTQSVAHNLELNNAYSFTRIYGAATDPLNLQYIPLPYASPTAANNIELSVDGTNVNITTGSNRSNFTTTYIILEYLKN